MKKSVQSAMLSALCHPQRSGVGVVQGEVCDILASPILQEQSGQLCAHCLMALWLAVDWAQAVQSCMEGHPANDKTGGALQPQKVMEGQVLDCDVCHIWFYNPIWGAVLCHLQFSLPHQ